MDREGRNKGEAGGRYRDEHGEERGGQESGRADGEVDVLAQQVGGEGGQEGFGVEVDVLVAAVEMGGEVIGVRQGYAFDYLDKGGTPVLCIVSKLQVFVLEHVGAKIVKHQVGPGAGKDARELDDTNACERCCVRLCLRHVPPRGSTSRRRQADGRVGSQNSARCRSPDVTCIGTIHFRMRSAGRLECRPAVPTRRSKEVARRCLFRRPGLRR